MFSTGSLLTISGSLNWMLYQKIKLAVTVRPEFELQDESILLELLADCDRAGL